MDSKSCSSNQYPMNRAEIRKAFRRHYGSARWAAAQTGVHEATVSKWLRGKPASKILDAEMPRLAQLLKDTHGACIKGGAEMSARFPRLHRPLTAQEQIDHVY